MVFLLFFSNFSVVDAFLIFPSQQNWTTEGWDLPLSPHFLFKEVIGIPVVFGLQNGCGSCRWFARPDRGYLKDKLYAVQLENNYLQGIYNLQMLSRHHSVDTTHRPEQKCPPPHTHTRFFQRGCTSRVRVGEWKGGGSTLQCFTTQEKQVKMK